MSNNPTITRWLNGAAASRKRYGEQVNQDLKKLETVTDEAARLRLLNRICEANLQLVANVVKRFVAKRPAKEWNEEKTLDILQEGYFGLRRAAEKFEFSKGCTFATYASIWIKQAIGRYRLVNYSLIYVPENTLSEVFYEKKHGKREDKKRYCNRSTLEAAERALSFRSLDAPVSGKGGVTDGTTVGDLVEFTKKAPTPVAGEHTWASRMLDEVLAEAGIGGETADLVRAYARRGRLESAAYAVGMGQHPARRVLREAIAKLERLA